MSSFSNRRPIERMHSASELVSSGSFASPLAQLSLSGGSGVRHESHPPTSSSDSSAVRIVLVSRLTKTYDSSPRHGLAKTSTATTFRPSLPST